MTSNKEQILEIKRGVDEILVEKDFLEKLKKNKPFGAPDDWFLEKV